MPEDRLERLHSLSQSFLACEKVQFSVSFVYGSLEDLLTEVEFDPKLSPERAVSSFVFQRNRKRKLIMLEG
jgi:hypothetical protein